MSYPNKRPKRTPIKDTSDDEERLPSTNVWHPPEPNSEKEEKLLRRLRRWFKQEKFEWALQKGATQFVKQIYRSLYAERQQFTNPPIQNVAVLLDLIPQYIKELEGQGDDQELEYDLQPDALGSDVFSTASEDDASNQLQVAPSTSTLDVDVFVRTDPILERNEEKRHQERRKRDRQARPTVQRMRLQSELDDLEAQLGNESEQYKAAKEKYDKSVGKLERHVTQNKKMQESARRPKLDHETLVNRQFFIAEENNEDDMIDSGDEDDEQTEESEEDEEEALQGTSESLGLNEKHRLKMQEKRRRDKNDIQVRRQKILDLESIARRTEEESLELKILLQQEADMLAARRAEKEKRAKRAEQLALANKNEVKARDTQKSLDRQIQRLGAKVSTTLTAEQLLELERLAAQEAELRRNWTNRSTGLAILVPRPRTAGRPRVTTSPDYPDYFAEAQPNIKKFRDDFVPEQKKLVQECVKSPGRLVVAPTGFGKTWMMIDVMLRLYEAYRHQDTNMLSEMAKHRIYPSGSKLVFHVVLRKSTIAQVKQTIRERINHRPFEDLINYYTHTSFVNRADMDDSNLNHKKTPTVTAIPIVIVDECQTWAKKKFTDWTARPLQAQPAEPTERRVSLRNASATPSAIVAPYVARPQAWKAMEVCTKAARVYLFTATPCNRDYAETKSLWYLVQRQLPLNVQDFNHRYVKYGDIDTSLTPPRRPILPVQVQVEDWESPRYPRYERTGNPIFVNWECLVSYYAYDIESEDYKRRFPQVEAAELETVTMTLNEQRTYEELERDGGWRNFGTRLDVYCQNLDSKYQKLLDVIVDDYHHFTYNQTQPLPFKMLIYVHSIEAAIRLRLKLSTARDLKLVANNLQRPDGTTVYENLNVMHIGNGQFTETQINNFRDNYHICIVNKSGIEGFDPPPLTSLVSMGSFWVPSAAKQLQGRLVRRNKWLGLRIKLRLHVIIVDKTAENSTILAAEREQQRSNPAPPRPVHDYEDDEPDELGRQTIAASRAADLLIQPYSYDRRQVDQQDMRAEELKDGDQQLDMASHWCRPQDTGNAFTEELVDYRDPFRAREDTEDEEEDEVEEEEEEEVGDQEEQLDEEDR